jgi:hypothetical protein
MARIFISYARIDEPFARQLAAALSKAEADVWLDVEDIPAGMNWSSAIQQGLNACELMIVILSPESMASRNVENEWQFYLDEQKPIIPVLWRKTRIHFQLNRLQYINFESQAFDEAWKQFHAELGRKGIALKPLPDLSDTSGHILIQPPLPVLETHSASPRPFANRNLLIGCVLLGLIALLGIGGLLLSNLSPALTITPTTVLALQATDITHPTLDATEQEATVQAQVAELQAAETQFILTATASQWTPIPTLDPRSTAIARASQTAVAVTAFAVQTQTQASRNQTATASIWTDTPTPTPVSLTQTFTSTGGVQFQYPDGWQVQEADMTFILTSSERATAETANFQSGDYLVVLLVLDVKVFTALEGADLLDVAANMTEFFTSTSPSSSFGETSISRVGELEIAQARSASSDGTTQMLIADYDHDRFVAALTESTSVEMDVINRITIQILSSIAFGPIS